MAYSEKFVSKDLSLIPLESEFVKYNLTFKEGTSKNCPEFKQQLLLRFISAISCTTSQMKR